MKVALAVLLTLTTTSCVLIPVDRPGQKAGGGTTVVCHKGKKTMDLPQNAVQAHLDHGDRLGPC